MTVTLIPLGLPRRAESPVPRPTPPPWMYLVRGRRPLVWLVDGSQLFEVSEERFARLTAGDADSMAELRQAAMAFATANEEAPFPENPSALSLNLAQTCNLSCSYCYADEGRFGGKPQLMPLAVALEAVQRLIVAAEGRRVTIGFIGGEPFLNRDVLHRCVDYAQRLASQRGVAVAFSVTTNGTLLQPCDLELLREVGFAVSVSLDGVGSDNDRHRRARGYSASAAALKAIRPLLDDPGRARVVARATIGRDNLCVAERVEALAEAGFHEIGVSPLRTSADPALQLQDADWPTFLREMIRAAEWEWNRVRGGGDWRFSNLAIALKELGQGSCRPLPCGAASGYVSVSAAGDYFTCHRTIDDPRFLLGNRAGGPERAARLRFITERHVDRQEPCRSCWARYLCGGGCHAETIASGRTGCDYIRGWLEYCIALFDEVSRERPDLVSSAEVG